MNERVKELLASPGLERLNDWVNIGPVQRAALEEFAELVVRDCAAWQGLTDEEIDEIYAGEGGTRTRRRIVRLIEAKLKEKNT